jgi:hypothetical protein
VCVCLGTKKPGDVKYGRQANQTHSCSGHEDRRVYEICASCRPGSVPSAEMVAWGIFLRASDVAICMIFLRASDVAICIKCTEIKVCRFRHTPPDRWLLVCGWRRRRGCWRGGDAKSPQGGSQAFFEPQERDKRQKIDERFFKTDLFQNDLAYR